MRATAISSRRRVRPTGSWPLPPLRTVTKWVSPSGTGSGTFASPMSFSSALSSAVAGDTMGLRADLGNYTVNTNGFVGHSGTSSNYIQWRGVDASGNPAYANFLGNGGSSGYRLFVLAGQGYHDFRHISFNGNNDPNAYEFIQGNANTHHLIVANCRSIDGGFAGFITSPSADYIWIIGNDVWRFGDGSVGSSEGSSGISINHPSGAWLFDSNPGFHNLIIGNRVSGGIDQSNADADGNGIILDLGGAIGSTLIANNLCYMNGGRGFANLGITSPTWHINNTCWKNGLDLRKVWMEFGSQNCSNQNWANNIAVASTNSRPYWIIGGSVPTNTKNAGSGGLANSGFTPTFNSDPQFQTTPTFSEGSANQWQNPPQPWNLASTDFKLSGSSPYRISGVDPRTLSGLDSTMVTQVDAWVGVDRDGNLRPAGQACSLGCYEV